MTKGLLVSVLRDTFTGKPDQATSREARFILTHEAIDEVFEVGATPELVLLPGLGNAAWRAVPRELVDSGVWTMFGGRYVVGDSRVTELVGSPGVIPVHDWTEPLGGQAV